MKADNESGFVGRVSRKAILKDDNSESEIIELGIRKSRIRDDDSESEIIERSRRKHRELNSEDDLGEDEEVCLNPYFVEIFGTGREYDYIYDDGSGSKEEEKIDFKYDENVCYHYVKRRLPPFGFSGATREIICQIAMGVSPELLGYHSNGLNVIEAYYVKDLIEEYRRDSVDKMSDVVDVSVDGFLSLREFVENLRRGERIYRPSTKISVSDNTNENIVSNTSSNPIATGALNIPNILVNAISNNKIFREEVERCKEFEVMAKHYGTEFDAGRLFSLFLGEDGDPDNEMRELVVKEAYRCVRVNTAHLEERLGRTGFCDKTQTGLRRWVSLLASLRGQQGVKYGGIVCGSRYCWVVTVDERGLDLRTGVYRRNDLDSIKECIGDSAVVCVMGISGQATAIRQFLRSVNWPVFYVPSHLAVLSEGKEYETARDGALLVQNPLVYFSRYVYSRSNGNKVGSNIGGTTTNILAASNETIERGIRIVLGACKLDWVETLDYKDSYALFAVLGISLNNDYFDYRGIRKLNDLQQVFSETEFANICGYFTFENSTNVLDTTHVHPKDYSTAERICLDLQRDNGQNTNIGTNTRDGLATVSAVKWALERPSLILGMKIPDNDSHLFERVRDELVYVSSEWFCGASDKQVFEDLVPFKQPGQASGYVVWSDRRYSFVDCGNGVVVNVHNSLEAGDRVAVEIGQPIYNRLCYSGNLRYVGNNEEDNHDSNNNSNKKLYNIIKSHELFRPLDQSAIEECMDSENRNVLVRLSEISDYCVVVCRIQPRIFWQLPLCFSVGLRENSFRFGERKFISLDDFINNYVKPLFRLIFSVSRFKHFYSSVHDARAYVANNDGKYMKYALTFSITHSGFIEFHYANKTVLALLDATQIVYRDHKFKMLEEFINYAKKVF